MNTKKRLTNLQLELLEVFKYELSDTQIKEIRNLLVNYFTKKITTEMDALFEEKVVLQMCTKRKKDNKVLSLTDVRKM